MKPACLRSLPFAATLTLGLGSQLLPGVLLGQESSTNAPRELERVVVTGSFIPTADEVAPVPVQVYSAEVIRQSGSFTINELTKRLPSFMGNGNFAESRSNGGSGQAGISLRGVGGGTLVLINGRRFANADLNTIPVSAVDRIEVLKDGASAVYGADAVGGVVNIILRQNYKGAEAGFYYGNTSETDMSTVQTYFLIGESGEKGGITVGGQFQRANGLFSVDRDRSRPEFTAAQTSGSPNPGRIRTSDTNALALFPGLEDGLVYRGPVGSTPTATGQYSAWQGLPDRFPFPVYTPAILANERYNLFGTLNRKLIDDNLEFFAEGSYANNTFHNQYAPTPGFGLVVPADNPFNRFGVPLDNVNYRFTELGPRLERFDGTITRYLGGFRGEIPESSWRWEAAMLFTRDERPTVRGGDVSQPRLDAALNSTDPSTAYNILGFQSNDGRALGLISQESLQVIRNDLWIADVKANGEIFDLPAGPIQFALGYEHRDERTEDSPDAFIQSGDSIGFGSSLPFLAGRSIDAGWSEIIIPITSPSWNAPGFYRVELGAAGRFERYSDFGNNGVPKVSLRWHPFDPTFMVRASYSESFQAPTISQLYSGGANFPVLNNRYLPESDPSKYDQIEVNVNPNLNLRAASARNFSAGFVWTPAWKTRGKASFEVDFYRIEQSDVVGGNPQGLIDANFRSTGGDPTRISQGLFGANITADDTGFITLINFQNNNESRRLIEGVDLAGRYELPLDSLGKITFDANMAYVFTFKSEVAPGAGFQDYLGDFTSDDNYGFGSIVRLRGRAGVIYEIAGFTLNVWSNYIGSYRDDVNRAGGDRAISDYVTLDLQAGYSFKTSDRSTRARTSFVVGVNNALDVAPPLAIGAFADNYDRDTHDLRQRFYYLSVQQAF
jgi:iron complex outermembrane recepter protein